MGEIARQLGEAALGAIVEAIRTGKSRSDAIKAAAAALEREDVVSDELWKQLTDYIVATKDFEENGA